MADYKQTDILGSKYTRWRRINIENPREGIPSATILEEEVMNMGDQTIDRPSGNLNIKFSDPSKTIPLRNPLNDWIETGSTMTMGELYAAIGSACWQAALERDAAQSENPDNPV